MKLCRLQFFLANQRSKSPRTCDNSRTKFYEASARPQVASKSSGFKKSRACHYILETNV